MYGAKLIFRSFATFFGLANTLQYIFDQVTNKGFTLLAAGKFETRLLTSHILYYNLPLKEVVNPIYRKYPGSLSILKSKTSNLGI